MWGLEVSEYASQKARARFGDRITTGTLQQGHYKSEFFDAITAFDVVEHIGDPLPFIREIYRLLKPAGVFAVSTADIQSISARFMGSFWPHLKPEHVCFFSTTLLQATLEKAGFSIIYKGAARKKISLTYMQSYFAVFGFPFLSFVLKAFAKCLPKYLRSFPVTIPTGEIFIIAQK